MQSATVSSDAGIITNLPSGLRANWETAAKIKNLTLTDFVINAANDAMEKTFSEQYMINLSAKDQIQVAEDLLVPSKPLNEAMQNALRKHYARLDNTEKDALREHFEHSRNV